VTAAAFVGNGVGLTGLVHTAGDTMTGALNLPAGGLAVGANQLVVTPSGNVGIGMASPPHMLDVNATSGIPTIAVGDLNGTNALFYMRANVGSGAAGTLDLLSRNAHDFTFISFPGGVGTEYMRIKGTNGNVGIGTSNPTNKLHVVGTVQATAYITGSDRNAKENVQPVSVDEILAKVAALPISTWTFKEQDSGTHLGPMAQDFYAAFNLGNTDSGIFTVDENGVALAAIQGLKKDADAKDAKIEALQRQVDELRALIQQLSTQGK
jgi:outer membrane murein-binding lipoprotein Lpp